MRFEEYALRWPSSARPTLKATVMPDEPARCKEAPAGYQRRLMLLAMIPECPGYCVCSVFARKARTESPSKPLQIGAEWRHDGNRCRILS